MYKNINISKITQISYSKRLFKIYDKNLPYELHIETNRKCFTFRHESKKIVQDEMKNLHKMINKDIQKITYADHTDSSPGSGSGGVITAFYFGHLL